MAEARHRRVCRDASPGHRRLMHGHTLAWVEPLRLAEHLYRCSADMPAFAFLYSGLRTAYSGRYSFIACHPREIIQADDWRSLPAGESSASPLDRWFGTLCYEIGRISGSVNAWPFSLPRFFFAQYATLFVFDHDRHTLTRYGEGGDLSSLPDGPTLALPPIAEFTAQLTRADYLSIVEKTLEAIRSGAFYQANITCKHSGTFVSQPDPFMLFRRLHEASPAPYSALLKCGDTHVLSSSPERFLTFSSNGQVSARPIKGSAPRSGGNDAAERAMLAASAKDRAENLMIVDLMRNDLAQSCIPGSVRLHDLCTVDSFATIHHLSSEVHASRPPNITPLDLTKRCFPPGSMTGAPKRAAIDWCAANERHERGIYSGALGWIGSDGTGDLSVVIRSIVLEGARFELQSGGGIVADSDPEKEWLEMLQKIRATSSACGIHPSLSHSNAMRFDR